MSLSTAKVTLGQGVPTAKVQIRHGFGLWEPFDRWKVTGRAESIDGSQNVPAKPEGVEAKVEPKEAPDDGQCGQFLGSTTTTTTRTIRQGNVEAP